MAILLPMSLKQPGADAGFAAIVMALGEKPRVSKPGARGDSARRFGSSALLVDGRIFALVSRGRLVLKLPSRRVVALIASGDGEAYDAGKGRPMKEWVALAPDRQDGWLELATEALTFVSSKA